AGIMVMDELSEVNRRLKALEAEVDTLKRGRDSALTDQARSEELLASALSEVTSQIHTIAAKLNGRATSSTN
ncbi:MAG: cell division protein ZapA, partial [Ensifer adhaerens]